jgi:phytoene dehydrogenase-like protein
VTARLPDRAAETVVVGSGPNGLAAAIVLARAGREVTVLEGATTLGGGCRSEELTLPGFVHDTCSTVHALALASPFLRSLRLEQHGLALVHPEAPLAHPLDDGSAVLLERSVEETARGLGSDAQAYRRLFDPLVRSADELTREILGPLRPPRHPLVMACFAPSALRPAMGLGRSLFEGERRAPYWPAAALTRCCRCAARPARPSGSFWR